jgi:glutathione S-transferase
VLRWSFAAMNTIELPLLTLLLMDFVTKKDEPPTYRDFTLAWARRHLGNLDRWLDGRDFIATEAFTVADILMAHALDEIKDASLLEPYGRVASYRARCFARPAWKRALESYCKRVDEG